MKNNDATFAQLKSLDNAVTFMKERGVQHKWFCHYTSLDKFKLMLATKTIWLTRCSSLRFDDTIEGKKYGSNEEASKRYIACFSIGKPENAAMWGLYCPPTYKAIRIVIPKDAMNNWVENIDVFKVRNGGVDMSAPMRNVDSYFSDIVYASVRGDDDDRDRSNTIFWEGESTEKIVGLEKQKRGVRVTGRVKDYEWRFERESRLIVKVRNEDYGEEFLAVRLSDDLLRSFEFTFSPWANDDEKGFVRNSVTDWLQAALNTKSIGPKFDVSMLNEGLKKWAVSRGV